MSEDWKVNDKQSNGTDYQLANAVTGGLLDFIPGETYTIENEETGETREVTANSEKELGEKISRGEFDD